MRYPSPVQSIRKYCIDCSGGSKKEVALCPVEDCPLYPFRRGTNPNRQERGNIANITDSVALEDGRDETCEENPTQVPLAGEETHSTSLGDEEKGETE